MNYYWKTISLVLIGVIFWVVVEKQEKHIAVLLTTALCCIAGIAAAVYLKPVIQFIKGLRYEEDIMIKVLLNAVGIGYISEITGRICADTGNSSAAAMVRFLGSAAILYSTLPLFQTLISLIQDMIGIL